MNIKQVSEEKGISADTLRYYERIGLIPPVNRTNGGIRDYTEEDLRWVDFTLCMRSAGLSIESLTEYIRLYSAGDETILARRDLLMEESEQLAKKIAEMQACQERLQKKIARYNQDLVKGDPILA
ncbi:MULTISPECIES: MerR family transcriptional regulator [Enterococcus]|uniref:MerR family transcriptional regulator n=1 Tax=Enterococcus mundtii TaxID=53346 RepID=A0A1V2UKI3_ENTMU|nr:MULTISPECIES: MerR family transcriptional regulator [Enterococcus]AZP92342.1 MerR family transcriptional regulator [Enterococcus mundtii]EOH60686.1 MerR family transcriptional regulator [Enterococcus mundtii ATCC 882]EOU12090.1 MerR family transcriptional regulator [Enterococcus mundtii ATCC 882]EYT94445.1 transcriptional regulator [Enterococcus mundtii CRL35]MBE9911074.1 MerR family transcriptional regulator [Enterococcus mundtii]